MVLPLLGHVYLANAGGTLLFPLVAQAISVGMAEVVEDKEGVWSSRGGVGATALYQRKRGRWATTVTGVFAE